jgi:glycine betaine/choline ABC-type transport system substrate-binding protein
MRQLNAQVDIEQEDPEDVAAAYLEEQGIVK